MAYDLLECSTDNQGYLTVPEYRLVPRGWYKGNYLLGRKPEFKDLELSIENYHVWMTRKQITRSKKMKEGNSLALARPDGFEGPFRIEVVPR